MLPVHPSITRRPPHRRALDVQLFARDDGLFDVEASLIDTKSHDVPLAGAPRKAGDPIHEMQLHLTVDAPLTVSAASSDTWWLPYPGACADHGNGCARLVGLNLLKGFRKSVADRLPHAPSALAPEAAETPWGGPAVFRECDADGNPPFQLDHCHALKRDGAIVAKFYPRWHLATPEAAQTAS